MPENHFDSPEYSTNLLKSEIKSYSKYFQPTHLPKDYACLNVELRNRFFYPYPATYTLT